MSERPSFVRRWWRFPVYALGLFAMMMGCYWLFLVSAPQGWGGRSGFQIFLFATLLLVIPGGLALVFGLRAILAAQERSAGKAFLSLVVALGAVPVAFLATIALHSSGRLPF